MIPIIQYANKEYPALQQEGHASKFSDAFAKKICSGFGIDCGCNRPEWAFVDKDNVPAILVDPAINAEYSAMKFPPGKYDYVYSSHMLEHYEGRFQDVVEYWLTKIKIGGVIFLYLPNCDYQKYWAWGNKKHVHYLSPDIMKQYCETLTVSRFIVTEGYDLNGSFYCIIEK